MADVMFAYRGSSFARDTTSWFEQQHCSVCACLVSADDANDLSDGRPQHNSKSTGKISPSLAFFVLLHTYLPRVTSAQQRRKEEQERARKAVQEKSAQVKREKEALSMKQELETAQAEEQARRKKQNAQEERQVGLVRVFVCKHTCTEELDRSPQTPNYRGVWLLLRTPC